MREIFCESLQIKKIIENTSSSNETIKNNEFSVAQNKYPLNVAKKE